MNINMNTHERESFIYIIRSGKIHISDNIYVVPPSIDDIVESYNIYNQIYNQCLIDGIMTEEDMTIWMKENLIWTKYNETLVEKLKKEIEDLKVDIFQARKSKAKCNHIRQNIRQKEELLHEQMILKNSEYSNTCEGISSSARINWLISQTTYASKTKYNFKNITLEQVIYNWQQSILPESKYRELARTEPWRSLWSISKNIKLKLFLNKKNQDLTINQKNLILWSQIYDNTYESMDCPDNEVFDDDDMFDGWMISQSRKNEKNKLSQYVEDVTQNSKIKNSKEIFIMANDSEHANNIYALNDETTRSKINNKFKTISEHGSILEQDLPDVKQELYFEQMKSRINK